MTTFLSYPFEDFSGKSGNLTISTGPVIVDSTRSRALLHISSSTGKYQFIGGRLDDAMSLQQSAIIRAREVIGENRITLWDTPPAVLLDTIVRNGVSEQILLIHYGASIQDESTIQNARWCTLAEVEDLPNS